MSDSTTTVADLRRQMQEFVDARDWRQFHTPKNLAMSLAIEAAELMEHFQWVDNAEAAARAQDPEHRTAIGEEIADVCCYLLSLVNALGLDLSQITTDKLAKNVRKYPAAEFRGKFE
jgi:NTP pyrophosphatase (non-canonical NTP hydrolase)